MNYTIKRGALNVLTVRPEGKISRKIMAEEIVDMSFKLPQFIKLQIGDRVDVYGNTYFMATEPQVQKVSSREFVYTVQFTGIKYKLAEVQLLFPDGENQLTVPDFRIMGTAETVLDLIIQNANRLQSGWTKGVVDETETKLVTFDGHNCLTAIAKVTEEFGLEFWIDGDKSIHLTERKEISGYTLEYGRAKGLRGLNRSPLLGANIFTRIYAVGADKNLPKNYRNGQTRLRMDVPYLEKNVAEYGVIEHTEKFEDVYPKRIGTVTAVDTANPLIFTDSTLDFDLNETDSNGTTILIPKVPAKVIFQTGQLAGYTLEIREHGYNSATKTFTLNKNENERALEIPNELIRPAVGDTYILEDIMMPAAYKEAAEAELKAKAQEKLDANCLQRYTYAGVADPLHFRAMNINMHLGNTVQLKDADFLTDDDIRVITIVQDLNDPHDVQFELADVATLTAITREYFEDERDQVIIQQGIKYNAEQARRSYQFAREFHDHVFDGEGYFDMENIKPLSIETKMLSLGSRLQQFGLPGIDFKLTNNTTLTYSAGKIVHQTINPDGLREWTIPANTVSGISTAFNNIYVKCQRVGNNASIIVTTQQIKVEQDPDFFHFEVGYLSSIIDGIRKIKTTYGFAQLNPAELAIGRISSPSGGNFIDLKPDGIDINGRVTFAAGSSGYNNLQDAPDLSGYDDVKNYVDNVLPGVIADLKNQVDGVVENWDGNGVPTLSNWPANQWQDSATRLQHINDTYVDKNDFRSYKFSSTGGREEAFSWELITDTAISQALAAAAAANANANGKRRVFYPTAYTPYDLNDLWIKSDGELMRCQVSRQAGTLVASDWIKATKYTDDTAANAAQQTANAAASSAANAMAQIDAINSDNVLSVSEKPGLLKDWNEIIAEHAGIVAQADTYVVGHVSYDSAYNSLMQYLFPPEGGMLNSMNVDSAIDPVVFRQKFKDYYDTRQLVLNAIALAIPRSVSTASRNLLLKSAVPFKKESGENKYLVGTYFANKPLLVGKKYTLVIKGSHAGVSSSLGAWVSGYQIIKSDLIKNETNAVKIIRFSRSSEGAGNSIDFYHFPSGSSGTSNVEWACLYEGDISNPPLDWSPAVEDVQGPLDDNTAAIAGLGYLQNFMQPTIDPTLNAIMAGRMAVGDPVEGLTALLSGITDKGSNSLRFGVGIFNAALGLFNLEILDNGTLLGRHDQGVWSMHRGVQTWKDNAGNIRKVYGWVDGAPVDRRYASDGTLLYEDTVFGPKIYAIGESWSANEWFIVNNNNILISDADLAALILPSITKKYGKRVVNGDEQTYMYFWSILTLASNYTAYEYMPGNIDPNNNQYAGYKTTPGTKLNTYNIPNGWYSRTIGEGSETQSSTAQPVAELWLEMAYVEFGRIKKTKVLLVEK